MSRPKRGELFPAYEVNTVHCIQRAVRRAWLAGFDQDSGTDFSFRREWIRRRLEALASVFGIDVLNYAILSNHLHVILRNRPDVVKTWSDEEVAVRWLRVFPGRRLDEQLAEPTQSDVEALARNEEMMAKIRLRLSDISWFMRALCEPIARLANAQDECTGRFWEGRFKAQKIADEAGLLACAMYVDLNPIRASMFDSLDEARHTSAYDRMSAERGEFISSAAFDLIPIAVEDAAQQLRKQTVEELKQVREAKRKNPTGKRVLRDSWLAPLTLWGKDSSLDPQVNKDGLRASDKGFLNMKWSEYIDLLRWTADQRKKEDVAAVPGGLAGRLAALGIEVSMWRDLVWNFKRYFGRSSCAGRPESLTAEAERQGKRSSPGKGLARSCFAAAI